MTDPLARLTAALADRYRIERELGQGGMATVYLAQDIKHDRKVAIKVLKPDLAAALGAERFLREIKTTAALQHPHILPLFDSGVADGFLYYVMPFIDGETLRGKLDRETQLGIDDAVKITVAVADALDYAHRHGVIHRDIKPENILLYEDRPMVADFGIAKAVSAAGATRLTESGLAVGTVRYMSPEQASADAHLDGRSDIYSLGCVLYELLTGEPPYKGATAAAITARKMTEPVPSLRTVRATVPVALEQVVFKALARVPADRFHTAAEFSAALTDKSWVSATQAGQWGSGALDGRIMMRPSRLATPLAVLAAITTVAAIWGWFRPEPPRAVTRYELGFPKGQAPTGLMLLSPDGAGLVYDGPSDDGQGQLWVKNRSEAAATPLAGTLAGLVQAVSPDGKWIAFTQGGRLKKTPVTGGATIILTDSASGTPVAWLDDGSLLFSRVGNTLGLVAEAGGATTLAWSPYTDSARLGVPVFPSPLPGSRGAIFSLCTSSLCETSEVWVLDLQSGKARRLIPDAQQGWYLPTGFLVYVRKDGRMFAVRFDPNSMKMRGTPVPVLGNISFGGGIFFFPNLTISAGGTLLMKTGTTDRLTSYQMVWIDRAGRETSIDTSWTLHLSPAGGNAGWSLSPDGKRLTIGLITNSGADIWIKELPTGPLSRITFDSTYEERPRWTPDGKSVTYIVDGSNALRQRPVDGTGQEETLVKTVVPPLEGSWSKDGKWLLLRVGGNTGAVKTRNILVSRPGVDSAPHELLASAQADESAPALSPDGKWLAYVSDETGRDEVYIRPFPNVDAGKWQVSTSGGQAPLWAHSGRELFYVDADRNMMLAPVPTAGPAQLGARVKLFTLGNDLYLGAQEYYTPFDISPDDKRFIMARQVAPADQAESAYILVENWFDEVKAKVGGK